MTLWTVASVHGILQARILEWVAIPFFRGSSWPRDWTWVSALQAVSLPSEPPGKKVIQFNSRKLDVTLRVAKFRIASVSFWLSICHSLMLLICPRFLQIYSNINIPSGQWSGQDRIFPLKNWFSLALIGFTWIHDPP